MTSHTRRAGAIPSAAANALRVATYNIHKGVRGGLLVRKRLEIHNLLGGIEALDADAVCLQEVRLFHHRHAAHFDDTHLGWPAQGQAEFLAPEGYYSAYRTNAVTRDGEHGNALLSRWPLGEVQHTDVSDHRLEQRGLLHAPVWWQGQAVHVVVAHLGLSHGSRVRQVGALAQFVEQHVPPDAPLVVAGDFNDWADRLGPAMHSLKLQRARPAHLANHNSQTTFPSMLPVLALDRVYTRGFACTASLVPRGATWARMSDHLPLVVDLVPL